MIKSLMTMIREFITRGVIIPFYFILIIDVLPLYD
jgi:hypothetical protein